MTIEAWMALLTRWSKAILADEEYRSRLSPEVIASGWLGYPGATEKQITQLEARLNSNLPPSYRNFLQVSNGWQIAGPFVERLWSAEEVEWHVLRRPELVEAWIAGTKLYGEPRLINDEDYFVYGEKQDPITVQNEYLRHTLEVSDEGDGIYLLNPKVLTAEGEWEAWFFAAWLPGARRYRSFWELMQAEYEDLGE